MYNIFFTSNFFGQTGRIDCFIGQGDCSKPDPLTSITYSPGIDSPDGWSFKSAKWSVTPASDISSSTQNTDGTFDVTWKNVNNTNQKKVTLTITVQKGTSTKDLSAVEKVITLKYISEITQLNISGNVSNTTISNGGGTEIACGLQNLTFSIPAPTTSPTSPINYKWIFPWGTQITSTPSISTISNVGQADGSARVEANRTDGNLVQVLNFNITRPRVVNSSVSAIDGSSISKGICLGQIKTFYANNNGSVTSYVWSTSGGLTSYSPQGAPNYVLISGTSEGILSITVDNACQSAKTTTYPIYIGTTTITSATVDWQPLAYPNYINNPGFLTINVNNVEGSSTNWTILNGAGSIYYAGQNQVSVYAYPFMRVEGVTSNHCGTGEARTFYVQDISNGYYRMASPNPATSIISSDILAMDALKKVTLVSAARSGIVRMYNANGSLNADTHRNNNLLSFDTGNLPRGLYYLNFFFEGNRNFTEQIELN